MNEKKNLMIIAGEASGDLHGAMLISELLALDKEIKIYGIGGDRMIKAGMEILYHIKKMSFLGFTEVIMHLLFIRKVQNDLLRLIKEKEIKNVVLIDYPGFNLNFAKKLKQLGVKIIYYISPQIWAWGGRRINKIKKLINKMLVVFPFEEEMYRNAGVDVEFVGHPLLEQINAYNFLSKDELYTKYSLQQEKDLLLLLPGSRQHEVIKIFPESIDAALTLADEFNMQVVVAASDNINNELFEGIKAADHYKIVNGNTYELMKYAKIGIIKSGTSTLEAALFELPMVVVYNTSFITYLIARMMVKLKNIAMANILAGENIVTELIQNDAVKNKITDECRKILSDRNLYDSMKKKLKKIKEKLGSNGASVRAAHSIFNWLNETKKN
jgi:lipid-A-disaccharide synthase